MNAPTIIAALIVLVVFAAMGAIKREMNSAKWTFAAIGYMCGLAYLASLVVYQLGLLFTGHGFGVGTAAAVLALLAAVYLLVRKNRYGDNTLAVRSVTAASKKKEMIS